MNEAFQDYLKRERRKTAAKMTAVASGGVILSILAAVGINKWYEGNTTPDNGASVAPEKPGQSSDTIDDTIPEAKKGRAFHPTPKNPFREAREKGENYIVVDNVLYVQVGYSLNPEREFGFHTFDGLPSEQRKNVVMSHVVPSRVRCVKNGTTSFEGSTKLGSPAEGLYQKIRECTHLMASRGK